MAKGKTKAPAEDEELEDLESELDELSEDEPEEKPAKKSKKSADEDEVWGVSDLCDLVKAETGKEYSTRDMRTLLRKMAREDKPRVNREVIAGNRARYSWTGPDDPEVKQVLKAVGKGEIEAGRKEALAKLKEQGEAKKAKKKAAAEAGEEPKKAKKNKK